ncbi:hypothetical protein Godav_004848, partial [Gossypium davidsonii]|nr:hypothetical protein [Gossypium davidsonii]
WVVRVGERQSLILKINILNTIESKGGKLFTVPGSSIAGSSGTTKILS